jgi:prepilin-type N-terminal cleavage/methylation domain-containing protein
MKSKKGFTLLECLIAVSISLLVLNANLQYFFNVQNIWQRCKLQTNEKEQAFFVMDHIREELFYGEVLMGANEELLLINSAKGVSEIYLKNKKVYRRRGNSVYLTSDDITVSDLKFGYGAGGELEKVALKFGSREELTYYF